MSKKNRAQLLNPKAAVCKELNCFEPASTRGFCRLHFLKVLAGKSEGDLTPTGKLKNVKERRRSDRSRGLEPNQLDDMSLSDRIEQVGEIDTDIDSLDLDTLDWKKTG